MSFVISLRKIVCDTKLRFVVDHCSGGEIKCIKRYFGGGGGCRLQRWSQRAGTKRTEPLEPALEGVSFETGTPRIDRLWKPLLFTAGFGSASLAGAAIWQYENLRTKTVNKFHYTFPWFGEKKKAGDWRAQINRWWNGLTAGERVFVPLCLINILVFGAWRVPRFQPTLVKYFCSNPSSNTLCWPMIFSVFSHYSFFHIFANMYVLHSFSRIAVADMGQEQFVGFFLAAGVISSMASYLHKAVFCKPGLSLGASGAIMGVLGYTCCRFPDLDLNIIFLPFFTFKAASALKVIMGLDAAGVLLGWKVFDHAAHLGGALFGVFWATWGHHHIWTNRKSLIDAWHKMRGPP